MYFLRQLRGVAFGLAALALVARAEEAPAVEVLTEAPIEEPVAEAAVEVAPAPEAAPEAAATEAPAAAEAAPEAAAPAEEAASSEPGGSHAIQKGDTLWDLAGRYYQDPYKWGRIWDANRDTVRNPNLIYPDQTLAIPGAGEAAEPSEPAPVATAPEAPVEAPADAPVEAVEATPVPVEQPVEAVEAAPVEAVTEAAPAEEVAAEPEAASVAAAAPEPPAAPPAKKPSRYVATDLGNDSYIVNEDWTADGYVLRDEQKKLMIAQDDVVYVSVGAANENPAKPYMRGGIYRKGGKIKDPETGEKLGYLMRRVGTLQLTENVGDQASVAIVTSSKEPIRAGDIVRLENN